MQRRARRRMLFLSILLAYAGMQAYALYAIHVAFALDPRWLVPFAGWLILMTFFPVLLWRLERQGWCWLAVAGVWVGYGWMGLVFLFFWIALALVGAVHVGVLPGLDPPSTMLWAIAITVGVAGQGVWSATRPRVERVTIQPSTWPPGATPVRIAMISDLHLGALVGRRALARVLGRLEALKPDLIVSCGDLVDGQADRLSRLVPMWQRIQPRLGKLAVIGNHECYVGLGHALDFHARSGFRVLRGESVAVTPALVVAGVDDPAAAGTGDDSGLDEQVALNSAVPEQFAVLLKHQPVVSTSTSRRADLQLSGHVHQGQIFPFNFFVRLVYPLPTGLSRLPEGGQLYVSRGTGTWGPPMRVLAAGEITVFDLSGAS